jgi:8-oxo-dGTP diphosphatase
MAKLMMVAGFLFCKCEVLLVQKTRPEWQRGCWNGIGGKREQGEPAQEAMFREFREETGIQAGWWRHFAVEEGPDYNCDFYASEIKEKPRFVQPTNDVGEPLAWRDTRFIEQLRVVGNLRWLIPLAQDWRHKMFTSAYTTDDIRERASW